MNSPISILVVDDHAMVRSMLQDRLDSEPDVEVVGSASDAEQAITLAGEFKPDIVLMDIDMPGMLCFDAAKALNRSSPPPRIIFLSAFFHDRYIEQALQVGAWGYVTKNQPDEALLTAIRNVASGIAYFSPEVQARIVVDDRGPRLAHSTRSRATTLTQRELEVLRYLARGMSKKEVAQTIHISVNTVNRHTSSLMNKLDIHDRVDLSRFAIREGLAEA
ncbi:MAG: response regulator transcription factor [Planctomycetota bacterium]